MHLGFLGRALLWYWGGTSVRQLHYDYTHPEKLAGYTRQEAEALIDSIKATWAFEALVEEKELGPAIQMILVMPKEQFQAYFGIEKPMPKEPFGW